MVDAHRNHPSIIAWSIGNEIDYPNDPYAHPLFKEVVGNNDAGKPAAERLYDPDRPDIRRLTTIAKRLADIVRAKDPTRPVTLGGGAAGAVQPDRASSMSSTSSATTTRSTSTRPTTGGSPTSRSSAARTRTATPTGCRWSATTTSPGSSCGPGIDYLGEAHGWPIHGSGAGLLTLAGFEKDTWHLRRSWWSDEPVAHVVTRPHHDADAEETFRTHPVSRSWDDDATGSRSRCSASATATSCD